MKPRSIRRCFCVRSSIGDAARIQTMQGNHKVIGALNDALREELMAINQYFLHAEMCENWHYSKLAAHIRKESVDEMKHAEALIERILFLDGTPNLTEPMRLTVGGNVKAQIEGDLKLEVEAVATASWRSPATRGTMRRANSSSVC
jgi:bacterioferritin